MPCGDACRARPAGRVCVRVACHQRPGGNRRAQPTAKLSAALSPEHLGQGTTIIFGFTIATTTGQVPSPLTRLDLYYPDNLGIGTSGLGLETCSAAVLEAYGPEGVPLPVADGLRQRARRDPLRPRGAAARPPRPRSSWRTSRKGTSGCSSSPKATPPSSAQIVFHGLVLPAAGPFGGDLATTIPLVPTLPGAPNAAAGAAALHDRPPAPHLLRTHPRQVPSPTTPGDRPAPHLSPRRLPLRRLVLLRRRLPHQRPHHRAVSAVGTRGGAQRRPHAQSVLNVPPDGRRERGGAMKAIQIVDLTGPTSALRLVDLPAPDRSRETLASGGSILVSASPRRTCSRPGRAS